jgi:hypothetical protein
LTPIHDRCPIYLRFTNMGGVDMTKMDDAAILQRAKEFCAEAGIAWDGFTAPVPDARILNDGERRECLMRARDELIREATMAGASSGQQAAKPSIPADQSRAYPDLPEFPLRDSDSFWPRRRAA